MILGGVVIVWTGYMMENIYEVPEVDADKTLDKKSVDFFPDCI